MKRLAHIFLAAGIFLAGCVELPPCQPVLLASGAAVVPRLDYTDLATVLDAARVRGGLLDLEALTARKDALDRQVALLAVTGPTASGSLFADSAAATRSEQVLAYWYNARAAWAMKLVLDSGEKESLRPDQLQQRAFPLDGRTMTLAQIDEILTRDPDWRTVVAAPGVLKQRAHLPEAPLEAQGIRDTIAKRFGEYVDDRDRLVTDVGRREMLVPAVFWAVRDRAIGQYEATYGASGATLVTALLPHVTGSPLRRLQDVVGYAAVPAPRNAKLAVVEEK